MRKIRISICLMVALMVLPSLAGAAIIGHLVEGYGHYQVIDFENYNVVSSGQFEGADLEYTSRAVADLENNRIFILSRDSSFEYVHVFSANKFEHIKTLDMHTRYSRDIYDVIILINKKKDEVYIKWHNEKEFLSYEQILSVFDRKSLEKKAEYKHITSPTGIISLSSDATKLNFYYGQDAGWKIEQYNSSDMQHAGTIDVKPYISNMIWGGDYDSIDGDSVLVVENIKQSDEETNRYDAFTVNTKTKVVSNKVETGDEGESFLLPGKDKFVFFQTKQIAIFESGFTGKMDVYDIATRNKLKSMIIHEGTAVNYIESHGFIPGTKILLLVLGKKKDPLPDDLGDQFNHYLYAVNIDTYTIEKVIQLNAGLVKIYFP